MATYTTTGSAPAYAGDALPQLPIDDPAIQPQQAAPGTSPSTVALPGLGFESAFHGSNGHLWLSGTYIVGDTGIQLAAGTSPTMAASALSGGGFLFAWQGTNGDLWKTSATGPLDLQLAMMPQTSPSLGELANGDYAVAYQGSNGHIWAYTSASTATAPGLHRGDLGVAMAPGTSPSLAPVPGGTGGYSIAFQGSNGHLWVVLDSGTFDTGYTMLAHTSPSMVELLQGGREAAFQGSNGNLWTVGKLTNGDTGQQMLAGTSPSIAATFFATPGAVPTDDYYIAYASSANNFGQLVLDQGKAGSVVLLGNVAPGTSPSIAILGE